MEMTIGLKWLYCISLGGVAWAVRPWLGQTIPAKCRWVLQFWSYYCQPTNWGSSHQLLQGKVCSSDVGFKLRKGNTFQVVAFARNNYQAGEPLMIMYVDGSELRLGRHGIASSRYSAQATRNVRSTWLLLIGIDRMEGRDQQYIKSSIR